MSGEVLADQIRAELADVRKQGLIPTQLRLNQNAWNTIREHLTYGPHASRDRVLFGGVPCLLSIGLQEPFRIRTIGIQRLK